MLEKKIKLKENEIIVTVVRRYGLTLFWWWTLVVVLFALPFFFMFWLFMNGWWGQSLFVLSLVVGLFFLFRIMFLWKRNSFIITTHRLIDIEQRGFFDQIVSEIPYDQIEDVIGRVKGFWGTFLRFGNLDVRSGNGKVRIIIEKIKQPVYLQQEVNEIREKYLSKFSHEFSGETASAIIDKLYELELYELLKVKKAIVKRIIKLDK